MTYNSQVGNYTYGTKPHAVTQAGANTYIYDANGNMTSGAGRTIAYNYDNMPTSITKIGGVTATFVYDYAGQRIKKTASSVTTVYIGKLYECTSGTCTKYIFAGSNRIASKKSSTVYYYHTDHLGSSSIITDKNGNKVEDIFYYPYGEMKFHTGTYNVRHKFTGQEYDAETGLYYYGARYYDPKLGRFISADTIVPEPFNPQALNRYSYVINNPLRYADPTGHGWYEIISAIIIAVVAWAVDESGGNVSVGGGTSVDSSGHPNYFSWNPNTGETYQVNPGSTVGSGSYTTSLELYAWGTCVGCSNSYGNNSYGYGERDEDKGWYGGVKSYLKEREIEKIGAGHNVAAFIDELGIAAIDVLLPQSTYEVPLMFVPVGKYGLSGANKIVRNPSIRTKFLKELAESGKAPRWMNQWLSQGKTPPGYQVHHRIPLSRGGSDIPDNMRMLDVDMHKTATKSWRNINYYED